MRIRYVFSTVISFPKTVGSPKPNRSRLWCLLRVIVFLKKWYFDFNIFCYPCWKHYTKSQNVFLTSARRKFLTHKMYFMHTANSVQILNASKKINKNRTIVWFTYYFQLTIFCKILAVCPHVKKYQWFWIFFTIIFDILYSNCVSTEIGVFETRRSISTVRSTFWSGTRADGKPLYIHISRDIIYNNRTRWFAMKCRVHFSNAYKNSHLFRLNSIS